MDITKPSQILSYLYLGNKQNAKNKEVLLKYNIKYILNCTPKRTDDPENGCPNYYEKEKSFIYKRIPIFDNRGEDLLPYMNVTFNFIEESKHYGNILVHCHKGISRSASFVIGYLMRKNEFTLDEALTHVQSCRSIVQPNQSFMIQLTNYQTTLQQLNSANQHSNNQSDVLMGPSIGPSFNQDVVIPISVTDINTLQSDSSNLMIQANLDSVDTIVKEVPQVNQPKPSETVVPNNIPSEDIKAVITPIVVEYSSSIHDNHHQQSINDNKSMDSLLVDSTSVEDTVEEYLDKDEAGDVKRQKLHI